MTSPVQLSPGEPGECHNNVAIRWIDGTITRIGTGYALSGDDLWRQQSWGLTSRDELVETTDQRHAYVGITLAAGPASMQLVSMIRELVGPRSRQ